MDKLSIVSCEADALKIIVISMLWQLSPAQKASLRAQAEALMSSVEGRMLFSTTSDEVVQKTRDIVSGVLGVIGT